MRKRSVHFRRTAVLVGAIAVAGVGAFAWHRGWLPFELTRAETGTLTVDGDDPALVNFGSNAEASDLPGTSLVFDDPTGVNSEADRLVPDQGEPNNGVEIHDPFLDTSSELAANFESAGRPSLPSRPDVPGRALARSSSAIDEQDRGGEFFGVQPDRAASTRTPAETSPRSGGRAELGFPARQPESSATGASQNRQSGPLADVGQVAANANEQLVQIDRLIEDNNYLKAHELLSKMFWNQPESRDSIQSRISKTAFAIYLAPQTHYLKPHVVQVGDNLTSIAKKYDVPWQYLAKLNHIKDPRSIQPGQRLKVIRGPFSAVIDLSEFDMVIHAHGYYVHRFSIGIGRDSTSPIGNFKVLNKVENPTYYGTDGRIIKADDPQNPVGEHWIDLGNSYGIHGTINPDSIGKAMSKGCIRMRNNDVAEVFGLLGINSEVRIQR